MTYALQVNSLEIIQSIDKSRHQDQMEYLKIQITVIIRSRLVRNRLNMVT